ncbi:MAG: L,D-transpeptidase/peptidoglycan binding protein [Arcanobacterium sp.]|nr:L,D-transpeptidase/peptidoglycan binding protein [Arcanobacterium sp.]MDY5589573.1 L,D-transpeptidase family protein [Arcanobacterium sp.]
MSTKKKIGISALIATALVLLGLGVYVGYFAVGHRALPGTYVGDVKVSGLTHSEITQRLALANDSTVNISGAGVNTTSATLKQMGFSFNPEELAAQAMAANTVWWKYATAPFNSTKVKPELQTDRATAEAFAVALTKGNSSAVAPVNPCVEFRDGKFVIKSGVEGKGVSVASLLAPASQLVATLSNVDFKATISPIAPSVKEEDLKAKLATANKLIAPDVSVGTADQTFTASPADKAAWVNLTTAQPSLNANALKAWVQQQGNHFYVEGVTGLRLLDKSGKILKVRAEAVPGEEVKNIDQVVALVQKNLTAGAPTAATFTIAKATPQWKTKTVAPGAENLPYAAAEGERWIDINLSTNRVKAYEGATLVYDFPMIDGAPATPTVQGEYAVYAKLRIQTMRGSNADGSNYETPDVPWVMYFTGGYATHGSSAWRSRWGYDAGAYGSHGCVNMANEDARTLWEWASVGTPVVSHA